MKAKTPLLTVLACAAAVLCSPLVSEAATYYVDPSGNDSNSGTTQAQAWRTPQKAANTATAGDTVNFNRGTYNITTAVTIQNSGTSSNWITFRATPGDERLAIINGTAGSGTKGALLAVGKSYIVIEGLKVQNVTSGSGIMIRARDGEAGTATATGIRIRNCYTYNTNGPGVYIAGVIFNNDDNDVAVDILTDVIVEDCKIEKACTSNANESISAGSGVKNIIVRNNEILDSVQYGIDFKTGLQDGEVYGNHIYDMDGPGIYMDAADRYIRNVKIYNNRVHNVNGVGIGLHREDWANTTVPGMPELNNISVYNNVVYDSGRDGIHLIKHAQDEGVGVIANISIVNNTVYNVGSAANHAATGIKVTHTVTGTNVRVRNNITWNIDGADSSFSSWVTTSNNLFGTSNPLFVNAGAGDFHIQSGSPARNAGTSTDAPATDFDGQARPQGTADDIGADEFAEGGSAPAAPSSLSATATSSSQINLAWSDNSSNETQFRIERKTGAGSYSFLTNKGAGSTSHSNTGLTASTTYTYRVRAENASGNSAWSNEDSATTQSGGGSGAVYLPLEAESGARISPMVAAADSLASGDQFVWVPQGTGNSTTSPGGPGAVTVSYSAPTSGTYALWARTIASSISDDSFFVRSDGVLIQNPWNVPVSSTWQWNKITELSLGNGAHTVEFRHREDGAKLDRLILTTDLAFTPTGESGDIPAGGGGAFQESSGMVVMEGENFHASDGRTDPNGVNWQAETAVAGYVGAGYVGVPTPATQTDWANGCEVSYNINFTSTGNHVVWVRRYAADTGQNSVHHGVDGTQTSGVDNTADYGSWVWKNLGTVNISSTGERVFQLRRREKGYKVDRILLTTNTSYTPSGNGPAESSQ